MTKTSVAFDIPKGYSASQYAIEGEASGPRFPWIQADVYRPSGPSTKVSVGMVQESIDLLAADHKIAIEVQSASFDDEGTEVSFSVPTNVRWVLLARPRVQAINKATGEIAPLEKGMKARGEVTISRLLLACVVGSGDKWDLVRDADGLVQIFMLKLKSNKTAWIGSARDKDLGLERNKGQRTIEQLNSALVAHCGGKPGQWLAHTASVEICARPEKFGNADGESSWGVRFGFPDKSGLKVLPPELCDEIHQFVTTQEFRDLARDPFARQGEAAAQVSEEVVYEVPYEGEIGMPF